MAPPEIAHRSVRVGEISMHVAELGSGPPVILAHGFPELWYSWRFQMPALAEAGYRAIAVDQRGYGDTDRPEPIEAYDIEHLTGDLIGLLDALGQDRAFYVGHDWGAIVAWQVAVMAPERAQGVVGMSVPFVPRAPVSPLQLFRAVFGDRFFYILYFQDVGPADRELGADIRSTLARTLWTWSGDSSPRPSPRPAAGSGYLDSLSELPEKLPAWLTDQDLDVYEAAYRKSGFTGPLNWYRNWDRNWEITEPLAGARVTVPAMFIAGDRDPVVRMLPPEVMDGWVTDLRSKVILPGAGHWVQQERPEEVNRSLLEFLSSLDP